MTPDDQSDSGTPAAGPRVILVTGGARGLGAAMVRIFTAAGHRVAVADTDQMAGARLAEVTGCLFVPTDVSSYAENQAAVRSAVARFGGLDAVCLNAGVPGATTFGESFDPDQYRRGMGVNLDGVVYGINAALPSLRSRGAGAVLITSSIAGIAPALDVYYSAAKHALVGLARSLALVLRHDHIMVNVLCPGFIDTGLVTGLRAALTTHQIAVAPPEEFAAAAAAILRSAGTGRAWEIQAGRPATLVAFPPVTLSRTGEAPSSAPPAGPPPADVPTLGRSS